MCKKCKFIVGALIGTLFGLAFAPKKGSELRKDLQKEIEKGGYGEKTMKKTANEIGKDVVETSKEVYNNPTVQKKIKYGTKEAKKLAGQAQKKIQESGEQWVKIARDKIVEGGKTIGKETNKAIDTLKKKASSEFDESSAKKGKK